MTAIAEPPEIEVLVSDADWQRIWRGIVRLARQWEREHGQQEQEGQEGPAALAGSDGQEEGPEEIATWGGNGGSVLEEKGEGLGLTSFHLPGKHDQRTHGRGGGALSSAPGSGSPWDGDKPGGLSEKEMEENGERVMGGFVRQRLIGEGQASPAQVQAAVEAVGEGQVAMRTWRNPFSPKAPWGGDGSTRVSVAAIASELRPTHTGSRERLGHIIAEGAVASSASAKVHGRGSTLSRAEKQAGMQDGVYLRDGIYSSGSAVFSLVFPRSVLNAKGAAAMPTDAMAYGFEPGKQGISGYLYSTRARAGRTDVVRAVNIAHMAGLGDSPSNSQQDYIVPRRVPLQRAEAILVNSRNFTPAELAPYKRTFAKRFPGVRWIAAPQDVGNLYNRYISSHLTGQLGPAGKRTKAQETLEAEGTRQVVFHLPGQHDQFTHAGAKGAAERAEWLRYTKPAFYKFMKQRVFKGQEFLG